MVNQYGYRWVHDLDDRELAHYAREKYHLGMQTVCGKAKIGLDWSGPVEADGIPEIGYPANPNRCGTCITDYLVETGQIRLVRRHHM